jgi:hypothetical protein
MIEHYQSYYWKMGKPYGDQLGDLKASISYKIVVDPYHKRYSIEKYQQGLFDKIIYDSILFDFRQLKPIDQMAWQRELLKEDPYCTVCLLRNQEDRAILLETQFFEQNWCHSCAVSSIHGIPLSIHRMYYQAFGDPFNGVILYDIENRPVMMKTYQVDPKTGEFTLLIKEEWDMHNLPAFLKQMER